MCVLTDGMSALPVVSQDSMTFKCQSSLLSTLGAVSPQNEFPGPAAVQNPDLPGKTPAQLAALLLLYPQQSPWVAGWHSQHQCGHCWTTHPVVVSWVHTTGGRISPQSIQSILTPSFLAAGGQAPAKGHPTTNARAAHMLRLQSGHMT